MLKKLFAKLGGKGATPNPAAVTPPAKNSQARAHSKSKSHEHGHKPKHNPAPHEGKGHEAGAAESTGKAGRHRRGRSKVDAVPAVPWAASDWVVPEVEGKTRFHDFDLHPQLLHGIADLGFAYCTPIQAQSLPYTLRGHDAIGKAQTGTGKTAAFLITIINDLLNNPIENERFIGEPRAVVIAPTRELVQQIAKDAAGLCKHTGLGIVTLIGGMDFRKQQDDLDRQLVDIVVATPGRLIDFLERGHVHLDMVEFLVIDEADRMLDMGFIPQVRRIVRATPKKTHRQTLLFSATFTPEIISLTEQWTHEPVTVEVEPDRVATATVEQRAYAVSDAEKFGLLKSILKREEVESAIIFANRRDQVRRLHERLEKAGFQVGVLSGEIPQNKRTRTLEEFRSGKIKVLVATDVAGRGIHITGISHVINYTLPEDPEDYVHRIGRTGRAGASGVSISLIGEEDAFNLMPIEQLLGHRLQCDSLPQ